METEGRYSEVEAEVEKRIMERQGELLKQLLLTIDSLRRRLDSVEERVSYIAQDVAILNEKVFYEDV